MRHRVWAFLILQLAGLVWGSWRYNCDVCGGLPGLVVWPLATAEIPWQALGTFTRVTTAPEDAVIGLFYLTVAAALAVGTSWWLLRGRLRSGVVLVGCWIAFGNWSLSTAAEVHVADAHDHFHGC